MTKTIEEKFKHLNEIEHIRLRPTMYVGSVNQESKDWYVIGDNGKFSKQTITFIPALSKIIDELLDNCADEHKRNPTRLTEINVTISDNRITICDNGGIPVVIHNDMQMYLPEMLFGHLRSGSNYDDTEDRIGGGTHGLGAKATNIFSKSFSITTADGSNQFHQEYKNGMTERSEPVVKKSKQRFTKIVFTPDLEYFGLTELGDGTIHRIVKRLHDIAGTNPKLKTSFNGKQITVCSFSDYVKLYTDTAIIQETAEWHVAVAPSEEGYQQISFVNTIETINGGTHVDYVVDQIVTEVRTHLQKKHKFDIRPNEVKSHFQVFVSATIIRPEFTQAKDVLMMPVSKFGTTFKLDKSVIKKILASPAIQSIVDWYNAKKATEEAQNVSKSQKQVAKRNPKLIDKFDDANARTDRDSCILFLAEGLSAKNSIISARGKNKFIGCYALKGKNLNVYDMKPSEVIKNTEFVDLLALTGLVLGEKPKLLSDGKWFLYENKLINEFDIIIENGLKIHVKDYPSKYLAAPHKPSVEEIVQYRNDEGKYYYRKFDLRFGKIAILADADNDGSHITSLLVMIFSKYWPELFDRGIVYRMNTPVYIATEVRSKKKLDFYSIEEYSQYALKAPQHKALYYKGLGTFRTEEFERFFEKLDDLLLQFGPISTEDKRALQLAFADDFEDDRKVWLKDMRYFDIELD